MKAARRYRRRFRLGYNAGSIFTVRRPPACWHARGVRTQSTGEPNDRNRN